MTVPVVAPPIPLRVVAAIVAVLSVAWNAASVTVTSAVPADTVLLPLTRASVNSVVVPSTLIALLTVTAPVVTLPIALRAVAAIVEVLSVAWNAVSVTVTSAVAADTVLVPLTRASVN